MAKELLRRRAGRAIRRRHAGRGGHAGRIWSISLAFLIIRYRKTGGQTDVDHPAQCRHDRFAGVYAHGIRRDCLPPERLAMASRSPVAFYGTIVVLSVASWSRPLRVSQSARRGNAHCFLRLAIVATC